MVAEPDVTFTDYGLAIECALFTYLLYRKGDRREALRTWQVEICYPQFPEFLRLKTKYDPEERFQSDWYRHYRAMFG